MTRTGTLLPTYATANQCKNVGETHYIYEIVCLFEEVLDSKGFLIDHNDINNVVKNNQNVGSCEECLITIADNLQKILPKSCRKFSITIKPWNSVAHLKLIRKL